MAKLLKEVRDYIPEANLYLEDSGNWCLLSGPSHDFGGNNKQRQDRVMLHERVTYSGGGAW